MSNQPDHVRLHIPGPVEISPDTYEAMATPMIGHRSSDFQKLYDDVHPGLQELFGTKQPVYLSTSSAWGVMEGSLRNLAGHKKVLCCCSGAFSDKWVDVARRCGKDAEALQYDWGTPIDPADVKAKLDTGEFDVVTFIHNETSTGVMNPLAEVAEVVRSYGDDVMLVTDTVSSFTVVPIEFDALGIDVILTGSQKALALPPGLGLFAVSERAMARAETINDRGYYFDFHEFAKNQAKSMTPSTPCIHTIYGLRHQLNKIFTEGVENRFARHEKLNNIAHEWVNENGFEFLAPEGFRSKSLTCVKNNKGIDVAKLQSLMRENHRLQLDGGYGKIKGDTFRISNMGDETEETLGNLLSALDDSLAKL
ncbi:MAG: alanine--glyoxylate aminotransferase family protein [Verrucomicrobiales bacterium]|nr:alanine--glyoxylate aminotransferase family protein [Verrucomicrobiales bacterium]